MSLEAALEANTAAVRDLITTWSKLITQGKNINARVADGEVHTVTAGPEKVLVAKVEPTAKAEPAAESPSEITYDTVSAAINAGVKADREKVVAALAKFGAKKGPELKESDWAAFVKEIA